MVQISFISGPQEGFPISVNDLAAKTGVIYYQLNPASYKSDGSLNRIKEERGYGFGDEIEISPKMPKYAEKVASYHKEHLHAEEEVRFIIKGTTFFDVRDSTDDSWIRIQVTAGDLLIIPAGLYHRLTLKSRSTSFTMQRLFLWKPLRSCYLRPAAERLICRKNYLDIWAFKNNSTNDNIHRNRGQGYEFQESYGSEIISC